MRREHVAIVGPRIAGELLNGTKHIETRFYQQRRPPWRRVAPGDHVHFKLTGGGFIGTSIVADVQHLVRLTPTRMAGLRRRFGAAVRAPGAYWQAKRTSRFGVLIWLGPLHAPPAGLRVPRQHGSGWVFLNNTPSGALGSRATSAILAGLSDLPTSERF